MILIQLVSCIFLCMGTSDYDVKFVNDNLSHFSSSYPGIAMSKLAFLQILL